MIEPMRRPNFRDAGYYYDNQLENFLMDFENACLEDFRGAHPIGRERYKHPAWAAHIKANVFPYHSDIDWLEYVEWVSNGGGDDWFQDEEDDIQTPVRQGRLLWLRARRGGRVVSSGVSRNGH